jgi:PhnB protein
MAKAKRSLSEQLNEAVEVIMNDPNAPLPKLGPKLTKLLQIAADLRDLPRQDFKAELKADLQRRGAAPIRVNPVPAGHHTATACLVVRDAPRAIEFYKQVFGATELMRFADPSGMIIHAEVQIGDSPIAIAEEVVDWKNLSPQALGGSPVVMQIYVDDVDAVASTAVAAGATIVFPVADQFYGDRSGRIADPFGHVWIVATHKEDVSVEEMHRRAAAWMQQEGAAQAHAPDTAASTPPPARRQGLVPYLQVRGADQLISFMRQAFGGEELRRETLPDGSVCHAEVRIGDAEISMAEATDEYPPTQTSLHLYVEDADTAYSRALRAGATSEYAPVDQPYGDREAGVKDQFGNSWYIATHKGSDVRAGRHVPEGLRSVTPYLHPHGASEMIEFLKQAFDAEEAFAHRSPSGSVEHAKIRIGDSVVEMGEAHGPYQPTPTAIHLYVADADRTYQRALDAGATSLFEPVDKDYGERLAGVKDRFGTVWYIATPKKD